MKSIYLFVCPLISHDTDSFHRQQDRERLANLIIQTCISDLLDVDSVCLLKNFDLLPCDRPKNPDSKTGTGERMSLHKVVRD